jgi:hypothetical protein
MLSALPDFSPTAQPFQVGIVFSGLLVRDVNLNLFADPLEKMRLGYVLDGLQKKYGQSIDIGALHGRRGAVPRRIPFGAPGEASP